MERHEIKNYLRSNVSIACNEPYSVRQMILQASVNIRNKRMAVGASKLKFESDEAELQIAQERLFTLRSLRAPINRLPAELLTRIFLHCLPTTQNATMNPEKPPLLLARICMRWRKIVYAHRPLWASLHIVIPEHSMPDYDDTKCRCPPNDRERLESQSRERYNRLLERFVDYVLAWIHRSGSVPLSLSLSMTDNIDQWPGDDPSFEVLNDGILSVCSRWSHIDFHLLEGDLSETITSLLPYQVPLLKSLKIHFIGGPFNHDPTLWDRSTIFKAPKLSVLSLSGPPSKTQNTPTNWGQLTEISICEVDVLFSGSGRGVLSASEAYDLLTNCTRLVRCTLHIYDQRALQPDPNSDKPIQLSHLQSLALVDGSRSLKSLVKQLKTPSLQSLSFHRMLVPPPDERTSEHSPLHTLVLLNKYLTHLIIDSQFTYASEIEGCFQHLPSITHFRSEECALGLSPTQTRSWNYSQDQAQVIISDLQQIQNIVWPHLTSFILHSGQNFTDKSIQTLMENRLDAHEKYGSALLTHVDVAPGQFLPSEGFCMDGVVNRYKARGEELKFSFKYLPQPKEEVRIDPEQGLGGEGGGRG